LRLNGFVLDAEDTACVLTMLAVAGGEMGEQNSADWIRKNTVPR
jgi:death-on-curing protein